MPNTKNVEIIALDQLTLSPLNPRRDRRQDDIEELAQNIEARGQLQPLIVHYNGDGTYGVVGGWRRYQAMKSLGMAGAMCLIRDEADIADGISENMSRVDMSEVDYILAMRSMIVADEILNIPQVAQRMGMTTIAAERIHAIATLPQRVLDRLEDGTWGLYNCKTIANAGEAAANLIENMTDEEWANTAFHDIATKIREICGMTMRNRYASFVGRKDIEKHCGGLQSDLFGEGETVINPDKVIELAKKKLADKVKAAKKDGWKLAHVLDDDTDTDAIPRFPTPDTDPEARQALEDWVAATDPDEEWTDEQHAEYERLDELAAEPLWTDDHKKLVAVGYTISPWGGLMEIRYLPPDSIEAAIKAGIATEDSKSAKVEAGEPEDLWRPKDLERLAQIKQVAAMNTVMAKPDMAITLLAWALHSVYWSGVEITDRQQVPDWEQPHLSGISLKHSELEPTSLDEVAGMSKKDREELIRHHVAGAIAAGTIPDWIDPDVRKHWTPTLGWLNTLKKEQLIEIGAEINCGQNMIDWGKASKAEMAALLSAAFGGTLADHYGNQRKEVYAAAKSWLPEPLRKE